MYVDFEIRALVDIMDRAVSMVKNMADTKTKAMLIELEQLFADAIADLRTQNRNISDKVLPTIKVSRA